MDIVEWSQILGNFGEFVGAVGVIVSLVYLALQVRTSAQSTRDNTLALLATTDMASNDGNREMYITLLKDPDLMQIMRNGHTGQALSREDNARYRLYLQAAFESHMTFFFQTKRGVASQEVWDHWSRFFDDYCLLPGVARVWQEVRDGFEGDFRDYMDAKLPDSGEGSHQI
jgi:hypothetical protein